MDNKPTGIAAQKMWLNCIDILLKSKKIQK